MKLRYLILDDHHQLKLIRRKHVEAIWQGRLRVARFGSTDRTQCRLVSVVCDDRLLPQRIYLLRLSLTNGLFTQRNCRTLRSFAMPDQVTAQEVFRHHSEGWPGDFFTQMAVALDVPRDLLEVPFGIGGPLLVAAAMRISPQNAARYLQ